MFGPKKYSLLPWQTFTLASGKRVALHRIQALVDIPLHGVRKGDLGGYVSSKRILSHYGSCWVGGDAIVHDIVDHELIQDDALVTDKAVVTNIVSGNSKVRGNAFSAMKVLGNCDISGNACLEDRNRQDGKLKGNIIVTDNAVINDVSMFTSGASIIEISGNVAIDMGVHPYLTRRTVFITEPLQRIAISGKVILNNVDIAGDCTMDGDFLMEDCSIEGNTKITGTPNIMPDSHFLGTNIIGGTAHIPGGSRVRNIILEEGTLRQDVPAPVEKSSVSATATIPAVTNELQEYIDIILDTEKEYESYTTDIVKLIKYPAMGDHSIIETKDFLYNLRNAKRAIKAGNAEKIIDLSEKVEKSFMAAENKAQTLVTSHLEPVKKAALKKASQMFAIAADEASPEPEKRVSVKAGLRSLEGIIAVSDEAVEMLKSRFGLRELEV
jgi:hypothetical protein